MENSFLITFINVFTIVNQTVVFFLLWFRKNSALTNKLFACIVFIPAFPFLSNLATYHKLVAFYPFTFILEDISFLWAPTLYAYVISMLGIKIKVKKKHLFHFTPFALSIIYKCWLFFNENERINFITLIQNNQRPKLYLLFNALLLIQVLSYLILSFIETKKHKNIEKSFFSSQDKLKITWLFQLIGLLVLLDAIVILLYFFLPPNEIDLIYSPLIFNVLYGLIVYYSFSNSAIFTEMQYEKYIEDIKPAHEFISDVTQKKKSEYLSFDKTKYDEYSKHITSYFITKKPYLDPELNVTKLSQLTAIPSHYISATLNQKMNTSFFDFVSSHRIEEVKKRFINKDHKKYSIESIAYECGFNSKATFYRVFKQKEKITPKEFISKLQY